MRFWKPTILCLVLLLFSTVASAKIVFKSTRNGVRSIYVMDDDGSNVIRLTDTLKPTLPRWSPDGKQIVFERRIRANDSQRVHLFIMNADGTDVQQLTEPHKGYDSYSAFSPDGKSIVFSKYERVPIPNPIPPGLVHIKGGKHSINVIDLETGKIKKISDLGGGFLDWSPDGKHIVLSNFATFGQSGSNVWIMDADGHKPRELLPPLVPGISRYRPRWSPDGKQILYYHIQARFEVIDNKGHLIPLAFRFFIYDIKSKTSRQLLIPKDWKISGLDWMDDDKSVLISAVEIELNKPADGTPYLYNIYKYHIRTHKITRLTDHPGADGSLDWIDDHAHAVNPAGKKKVQWGTLKKSGQTHSP